MENSNVDENPLFRPTVETNRRNGKMDIEKATFYFGIYSIVQAAGAIIFSLLALWWDRHWFSPVLSPWEPPSPYEGFKIGGVMIYSPHDADIAQKDFYDHYGPLTLLIIAGVSLLFSILLIIGLRIRKPSLILSFFIYGVIVTPILLAVIILYVVAFLNRSEPIGILFTILILLVVYLAGVVLSFKTYKLTKNENQTYVKFSSSTVTLEQPHL